MAFLSSDETKCAVNCPLEEELPLLHWEELFQLERSFGQSFGKSPGKGSGRMRFIYLGIKTVISFIIILLLTTGLSFVMPEGSRGAGGRYLSRIYHETKFKITGLGLQDIHSLLKAPEGEVTEQLEKAAAMAPFALKYPTYLPSQVALSEVVIYDSDDFELYFVFSSPERSFVISQRNSGASAITVTLDFNEDQAKEVYTYSFKGIFSSKDDTNIFSFVDDSNIHFLIYGHIEEAEIMEIAYSLQTKVK